MTATDPGVGAGSPSSRHGMAAAMVPSGPRRRGRSPGRRRSLVRCRASLALETAAGTTSTSSRPSPRSAPGISQRPPPKEPPLPTTTARASPSTTRPSTSTLAAQVGGSRALLTRRDSTSVAAAAKPALTPLAARRGPQSSRSRGRGRASASSEAAATGSGGMPMARARSLPVPPGRRATRGPSAPGMGRPLATSWTVPSPPNTTSTSTAGASSAARVSASPGSPAGYTGTRPNRARSRPRASGRRSQAADPTWAIQAVGIVGHPTWTRSGLPGVGAVATTGRGGRGEEGRVRVEIGAGERPDPGYEVHTDVLPLPGIQVVCHLDRLPFADGSVTALRANHVLEHQSFQLVGPTLREWARVLAPGAPVDIGVPDARYIVTQWVEGAYSTLEANYWLLGGHMDRDAHKGADERGVPRWIWNAHHAMFDDAWLAQVLAANGFTDIDISCYDVRNLRCYCR